MSEKFNFKLNEARKGLVQIVLDFRQGAITYKHTTHTFNYSSINFYYNQSDTDYTSLSRKSFNTLALVLPFKIDFDLDALN